mmetsp:Transcript_10109/g.38325  ORF Transcript_10109/g.38325 Transcript_10109/m.38325 type:complete len:294 (-) Transcript_10109:1494-2375(-)
MFLLFLRLCLFVSLSMFPLLLSLCFLLPLLLLLIHRSLLLDYRFLRVLVARLAVRVSLPWLQRRRMRLRLLRLLLLLWLLRLMWWLLMWLLLMQLLLCSMSETARNLKANLLALRLRHRREPSLMRREPQVGMRQLKRLRLALLQLMDGNRWHALWRRPRRHRRHLLLRNCRWPRHPLLVHVHWEGHLVRIPLLMMDASLQRCWVGEEALLPPVLHRVLNSGFSGGVSLQHRHALHLRLLQAHRMPACLTSDHGLRMAHTARREVLRAEAAIAVDFHCLRRRPLAGGRQLKGS